MTRTMRTNRRSWTRGLALTCLVGVAGLGACKSMDSYNPFRHDKASVQIAGGTVDVESGTDDASRQGVRAMRAEDWANAATLLEQSVRETDDDWHTLFALGVAYEKLGREEDALAAYQRANLNVKGAGNPVVTAAIRRMRDGR